MRLVREIPHPECRIIIYAWNNRYLIKVEQGSMEQTFKIDEYDVANDEQLIAIIDEQFIRQTLQRFADMARTFDDATQRALG